MPICTTTLYHFDRVTDPELLKIISGMNNTTCSSDPFPTRLLMSHLYAIVPILQHIVNLCLTTGDFPISCKSSIIIPLIKKPGGSKRHSLQAMELSQWFQAAVQIVSNLPAPSTGGPIYRFLGMRTRWMAGAAAHKSG